MSRPAFELDHVFVCTGSGAPHASRIGGLGIHEGSRSVHPGQGTSNRRFFFGNAMLELLWVNDEQEASSPLTAPTRLHPRWHERERGACPFGICLRPVEGKGEAPFAGWPYRPRYLPPATQIVVANNSDALAEPMLFWFDAGARPDRYPADRRQPITHPNGVREITRLTWVRPSAAAPSAALAAVIGGGVLSVRDGERHALEIGFDGEPLGRNCDLAPELPISLAW
jgi:hypothetical protein